MLRSFSRRLSETYDHIRSGNPVSIDIVPGVGTDGSYLKYIEGELFVVGFVSLDHRNKVDVTDLMIEFGGFLRIRVAAGSSNHPISGYRTMLQIVSLTEELTKDATFDDSEHLETFPFCFSIPPDMQLPPSCQISVGKYHADVFYHLHVTATFTSGKKHIVKEIPLLMRQPPPPRQLAFPEGDIRNSHYEIHGQANEIIYTFWIPKSVVTGESMHILYLLKHSDPTVKATTDVKSVDMHLIETITVLPPDRRFSAAEEQHTTLERRLHLGELDANELKVLGWVEPETVVCKLPTWSSSIDPHDEMYSPSFADRRHKQAVNAVPLHNHGHGHEDCDPFDDSAADSHGLNPSFEYTMDSSNSVASPTSPGTSPITRQPLDIIKDSQTLELENSKTYIKVDHVLELNLWFAADERKPVSHLVPLKVWPVPTAMWDHIKLDYSV
ncbi:hypothetical protein HK098_004016 [Nowakowskiella sp. JEL0407]|nr:hypothetical protein HK098_004016 [Nowakowskiella sp. JEL0407]